MYLQSKKISTATKMAVDEQCCGTWYIYIYIIHRLQHAVKYIIIRNHEWVILWRIFGMLFNNLVARFELQSDMCVCNVAMSSLGSYELYVHSVTVEFWANPKVNWETKFIAAVAIPHTSFPLSPQEHSKTNPKKNQPLEKMVWLCFSQPSSFVQLNLCFH